MTQEELEGFLLHARSDPNMTLARLARSAIPQLANEIVSLWDENDLLRDRNVEMAKELAKLRGDNANLRIEIDGLRRNRQ